MRKSLARSDGLQQRPEPAPWPRQRPRCAEKQAQEARRYPTASEAVGRTAIRHRPIPGRRRGARRLAPTSRGREATRRADPAPPWHPRRGPRGRSRVGPSRREERGRGARAPPARPRPRGGPYAAAQALLEIGTREALALLRSVAESEGPGKAAARAPRAPAIGPNAGGGAAANAKRPRGRLSARAFAEGRDEDVG